MTKLAKLIAHEEGFGRPGKTPTIRHNPGDLRHSPYSGHPGGPSHSEDIGVIDTDAHGWADLELQLRKYAARGMTLKQAIYAFAPPTENNTARYLSDVAKGLGVDPDTPLAKVLEIKA